MSVQTLSRCGAALIFLALVSGCSLIGPEGSDRDSSSRSDSECKWNRSSCMYSGQYEPGEESYAEQEAKRLNQASSAKLRRSAGR